MGISVAVAKTFDLIQLLLIIYVILTFVPNIKWYNEPFKSLRIFSEFFFAPFRKYIPPMGGIDLSPIAVFFLLPLIKGVLYEILRSIGL